MPYLVQDRDVGGVHIDVRSLSVAKIQSLVGRGQIATVLLNGGQVDVNIHLCQLAALIPARVGKTPGSIRSFRGTAFEVNQGLPIA